MAVRARLAIVLLAAVWIASCATHGVRIVDLKDRPGQFDEKTISITGVVTSSWSVPLVPFQFYNVNDGSGEITVLSRSGRAPATGTRVEVKGRLNEIASFGSRPVGLHLDERDRRIKG